MIDTFLNSLPTPKESSTGTSPIREILPGKSSIRNKRGRTSPPSWDRIGVMIRMFRMRKLITVVKDIQDSLQSGRYVTSEMFYGHTAGKSLFEEWYVTLWKGLLFLIGKRMGHSFNSKISMRRSQRVDSVLSSCRRRNFLALQMGGIIVQNEGDEFLEPLRFVETVLKEYGTIAAVFVGILGTSLAGVIWKLFLTNFQ